MNKNDFRNPLIQSGIVLLVVFILIAIVTNAGPNGMIGSIAALVTGIFKAILFVIALSIGILFSIAILIGIYIAAISFQSTERGREVYSQVSDSVKSSYQKLTGSVASKRAERAEKKQGAAATVSAPSPAASTPSTAASTPSTAAAVQGDELKEIWKNLNGLQVSIQELQAAQATASEELGSIKQSLHSHEEDAIGEKFDEFSLSQQSLTEKFVELVNRIESDTGRLNDLENSYSNTCDKLKEEIAELHKKTSVPEVVSGILSYIDSIEDRDLVTEKAEEAISRGMTYNQIDEFFKSSLDKKVYKVLAEHPRLTKDFLRSIKKKFA